MAAAPQALDRIRNWMNQQFKPAKTQVQEEGSSKVYRYQVEQGSLSPTLWIPQAVFDQYPAEDIVAALDQHHVAARLRSDPIAQLMCVAPEGRIVVVRHHNWRRP